jgi:hypothetical protein
VDAAGQYKRPEVLNFQANRKICNNDKLMRGEDGKHGEDVVEKAIDQGMATEKLSRIQTALLNSGNGIMFFREVWLRDKRKRLRTFRGLAELAGFYHFVQSHTDL